MAVSLIDDIYLYTGWTSSAQECYRIIDWLKNNNVKYSLMQYNDENQFAAVFSALNSWWEGATLSDFPVLVFTKIDLDKSPSEWQKIYYTTYDQLVADTEFLSLSKKAS